MAGLLGDTDVLDRNDAGEREVLESEPISSDDNPDELLSALTQTVEATTATLSNAGPPELPVHNSGNPSDRSGEVIHDRYRLLRMLGKGGMGTVYLAQHAALSKTFAVKLLNPRYASRADIADRFLQEAKAVSLIEHENVVGVTDFGTANDGAAFLVMEHLRGESLATLAKREAPLPWTRVVHIMAQLCRALQAAHDVGVVHRDVKPDNILRTERGDDQDFIKVLDFGLAKLQTGGGLRLTRTGVVLGTPEYMSPEQARGGPTDHRTDIYAAGIVMYVLLCGRPPFRAKTFVGMRNQHLLVAPEPPSSHAPEAGITDEMDAVVLRALAKQPGNRFESMSAMQAAIEAVGTGVGPILLLERGDTFEDDDPPTIDLVGGLVERGSMLGRGGRVTRPPARARPRSASVVADAAQPRRSQSLIGVTLVAVIAGVAAALGFGGVIGKRRSSASARSSVAAEQPNAAPELQADEPDPPSEPAVVAAAPSTTVLSFTTNVPVRVLEARDQAMFARGELVDRIEVPRSDDELELILRADGYIDAIVSVIPDRDRSLTIELEREPPREPKPRTRPKPKLSGPAPESSPEPEPPVEAPPAEAPAEDPPVDNSFAPDIVDPWKAAKGG